MLNRAGEAVEHAYWKATRIQWNRDEEFDPTYAVEKLIEAGRARASIHLIGMYLHDGRKFAAELLVKALLEAVRQPVTDELEMNERTMFQHYAQEAFKQLDEPATSLTKPLRILSGNIWRCSSIRSARQRRS